MDLVSRCDSINLTQTCHLVLNIQQLIVFLTLVWQMLNMIKISFQNLVHIRYSNMFVISISKSMYYGILSSDLYCTQAQRNKMKKDKKYDKIFLETGCTFLPKTFLSICHIWHYCFSSHQKP